MGNALFINGKIFDGEKILTADAFAIDGGRFSKIETAAEITKSVDKDKNYQIIDLRGALVLPGFIDAHAHIMSLGQSKVDLDLIGLMPTEIANLVKKQSLIQGPGSWIRGRGWDQNLWPNKNFPDTTVLDGIDAPACLIRVDGHAAWLNRKALALASIEDDTPDPSGGKIVRDINGRATGVLIDKAMILLKPHLDNPSIDDLKLYLKLATEEALAHGITSIHDAGANSDTIDLYEQLAKEKKLGLRIYAMINGDYEELTKTFLKRGPINIDDMLVVRSIKYFADGALGSRGAALLENYSDGDDRGLLLIDEEQLIGKSKEAVAKGFQVATHAIGDRANRLVLDAYEKALAATGKGKDVRLRIEHAQLIDPADHHRFSELSIIASMQPIHCTSDMAWVPQRLGEKRLSKRAYPWRSLLFNNAVLAFGSDAPVESLNPILGLYAAVSRSDIKGLPADGFLPDQKLSFKQALAAYYRGAAYAEFSEEKKGKIAEGFMADFVVFDTDILHPTKSSFLSAKPMMTVVAGNIAYRRANLVDQNICQGEK